MQENTQYNQQFISQTLRKQSGNISKNGHVWEKNNMFKSPCFINALEIRRGAHSIIPSIAGVCNFALFQGCLDILKIREVLGDLFWKYLATKGLLVMFLTDLKWFHCARVPDCRPDGRVSPMALSVVALSNNERYNIWQDTVAEQQETNIIKKRPGQPKLRASTRILSKPKFAALWTNAKLNRTHLDGHAYVQCLYRSVCLCLRTENRSRKTHVFEYLDRGVGWGGVEGGMLTFLVLRTWYIATLLRPLVSFTTLHVATLLRSLVWVGLGWGGGGHVNVPCTSYMIYCQAAEISGIVYYVACCYAAEISSVVVWVGLGWGGGAF